MAKSGLKKWFDQKWVDIGSKKKVEDTNLVVENLPLEAKENIPSVFQLQKLRV
tara:strand:+ start:106 stop:264 length:159 start_codon:yes stop_codon:yes gene_type:complete